MQWVKVRNALGPLCLCNVFLLINIHHFEPAPKTCFISWSLVFFIMNPSFQLFDFDVILWFHPFFCSFCFTFSFSSLWFWCPSVFLFLYFYFCNCAAQIFIGTQMLCCLNSCKPKFNSYFVLGHLNAFEAGVQCSFTFAPEVPFVTFHLVHIWCLILDAPVSTLILVHSRLVFTDLSMRARGAFCHFSIWCIFNNTCGCPL